MMTTQNTLLSNKKNKVEVIKRLPEAFRYEVLLISQPKEDADALIVKTAIKISETINIANTAREVVKYTKNVIIMGQDIDSLVSLHQLNSIFFKSCTSYEN